MTFQGTYEVLCLNLSIDILFHFAQIFIISVHIFTIVFDYSQIVGEDLIEFSLISSEFADFDGEILLKIYKYCTDCIDCVYH